MSKTWRRATARTKVRKVSTATTIGTKSRCSQMRPCRSRIDISGEKLYYIIMVQWLCQRARPQPPSSTGSSRDLDHQESHWICTIFFHSTEWTNQSKYSLLLFFFNLFLNVLQFPNGSADLVATSRLWASVVECVNPTISCKFGSSFDWEGLVNGSSILAQWVGIINAGP